MKKLFSILFALALIGFALPATANTITDGVGEEPQAPTTQAMPNHLATPPDTDEDSPVLRVSVGIIASIATIAILLLGMWLRDKKENYTRKLARLTTEYAKQVGFQYTQKKQLLVTFIQAKKLSRLLTTKGKTFAEASAMANGIDTLYLLCQAQEKRLAHCQKLIASATFWRQEPLKMAYQVLEGYEAVEFDSSTVSTNQDGQQILFFPRTEIIYIKDFMPFADLFRELKEPWHQLLAAEKELSCPAEDRFPRKKWFAMLDMAEEHEIPYTWLAQHPLYGDTEKEIAVYSKLNEERLSDPLSYIESVQALQTQEEFLRKQLLELVELKKSALTCIPQNPLSEQNSACEPTDDPLVTLQQAHRAKEAFFACLKAGPDQNRSPEYSVEPLRGLARDIEILFLRANRQHECLLADIQHAKPQVEVCLEFLDSTKKVRQQIETRLLEAKAVHASATLDTCLELSQRFLAAAETKVHEAEKLLADNRHQEALRHCAKGRELIALVHQECNQAIVRCETLDAAKREYEFRLTQMDDLFADYGERILCYGQSLCIRPYNPPKLSLPADFPKLVEDMRLAEAAWTRAERYTRMAQESNT